MEYDDIVREYGPGLGARGVRRVPRFFTQRNGILHLLIGIYVLFCYNKG